MSKGGEVDPGLRVRGGSSMSEIPVHSRPKETGGLDQPDGCKEGPFIN